MQKKLIEEQERYKKFLDWKNKCEIIDVEVFDDNKHKN
jgi:hypothetical protein